MSEPYTALELRERRAYLAEQFLIARCSAPWSDKWKRGSDAPGEDTMDSMVSACFRMADAFIEREKKELSPK